MTAGEPRADEIFFEAAALPAPERAAYLDRACADDASLRREVESLLWAHRRAGRFLEIPALARPEAVPPPASGDALIGTTIGSYRLERVVGSGGMGVVYLAARADDAFTGRVAIKLIRRGLDTDELLARFRRERTVLANLAHPNIARLIDAGATRDGRPYLIMEYVDGVPIDRYCDERSVAIEGRLRLFLQVCDAVQHAHGHLVVHRDLKPGNVLVASDGSVRLVDFGISKVLGDDERGRDVTVTGGPRMTPQYASPEQVRGDAVTTASDVYALGVVLYELLTGRRPYELASRSAGEVMRVVCDTVPVRPSATVPRDADDTTKARRTTTDAMRRRLRGDLDWITMRAMEKEPARRYATVSELAADLGRHLAHEPVLAGPPSRTYRIVKFVRRHRVPVAIAAIAAIGLLAGAAGIAWQAQVAAQQRDRARQRYNEVRELANSLILEIHDAIRDLPGATAAREALVSTASAYLDSLATESGDDPALLRELAVGYERLGDVQRSTVATDLGRSAAALASHRRALELRQRAVELLPDDPIARLELASSLIRLGDMGRVQGRLEDALVRYHEARDVAAAVEAHGPDELRRRRLVSVVRLKIGIVHSARGEIDDAAVSYALARVDCEELVAMAPEDVGARRNLAICHEKLGDIHQARGDPAAALQEYRGALAVYEALAADGGAVSQMSLAIALLKVAEVLGHPAYPNVGDAPGAMAAVARGRDIVAALVDADPDDLRSRRVLGVLHRNLAILTSTAGDLDAARGHQERALELARLVAGADAANRAARRDLAKCIQLGGDLRGREGDDEGARRAHVEALELFEGLLSEEPEDLLGREDVAYVLAVLGEDEARLAVSSVDASERTEHRRVAIDALDRAIAIFEALATEDALVASAATRLAEVREARLAVIELDATGDDPG